MISFNKPFLTGNELKYIENAVELRHLSGDGKYTELCQNFFQDKYGFKKCLLTTSCTDALEMAAILMDIKEGDEIIAPSYTFVSTVNAFVLRGAKIVFCDSNCEEPGMDVHLIESLITSKTKVIIPVHYAGVACDMDEIMRISDEHNIYVVEDAAQAIDSYYVGKDGIKKPLGSIGHLGTFSFHETKNIISGEGGMLILNDEKFFARAEVIREKGTNRSSFFRGEVDKYGWVDIGSSFLPSEITAAFLFAQLEKINDIQSRRIEIWNTYYNGLKDIEDTGKISLPYIPVNASNNAHMFYLVCHSPENRDALIKFLKNKDIDAVFHYLSLHKSTYYLRRNRVSQLINSDKFSDCLLRLPFYYEISRDDQINVISSIHQFFEESY
jgi:dTDP-4-amino-4,6-dideoxygalactose transaminase